MPDFTDLLDGYASQLVWRYYIRILAHEIGHFLTLPHTCKDTADDPGESRTGEVCVQGDREQIMHPTVAPWGGSFSAADMIEARARAAAYAVEVH
jgi:hypothetical protein